MTAQLKFWTVKEQYQPDHTFQCGKSSIQWNLLLYNIYQIVTERMFPVSIHYMLPNYYKTTCTFSPTSHVNIQQYLQLHSNSTRQRRIAKLSGRNLVHEPCWHSCCCTHYRAKLSRFEGPMSDVVQETKLVGWTTKILLVGLCMEKPTLNQNMSPDVHIGGHIPSARRGTYWGHR